MDRKMMTLAAVVSGMLTLASCGEVSNTSTGTDVTTTQALTAAQEKETQTELTTKEESEQEKAQDNAGDGSSLSQSNKQANAQTADTDKIQSSESDYQAAADTLLKNINEIDKFGASVAECDDSDVYTSGTDNYYHVTDSRFKSTSDVKAFIDETMTDKLYNERYRSIVGDDRAYFIDADSKLYIKYSPKGAGFNYNDTPCRIYDTTDTSFCVDKEYDDYGSVSLLRLTVVKTDAGWRIDTLQYGVQN
ncbi:MAG: hypothetical protein Q4F95_11415 [Oscillospiraceae bacterium]|nr:hypothetical protein [Oscillospiraceae bacterium]